ncbi:MAG: hypothetical protein PWP30_1196 [Eubacteriaceae bacterium]|jgi:hypothetical protein|nr:hypothetical protein [Eubacteriaceae bacterium]MDK2936456.1 hypothetical protein [Eubacteriaceae bacterium]MDK2961560.1 hypothetical protein [Eubacteriaceae bacterium]
MYYDNCDDSLKICYTKNNAAFGLDKRYNIL